MSQCLKFTVAVLTTEVFKNGICIQIKIHKTLIKHLLNTQLNGGILDLPNKLFYSHWINYKSNYMCAHSTHTLIQKTYECRVGCGLGLNACEEPNTYGAVEFELGTAPKEARFTFESTL